MPNLTMLQSLAWQASTSIAHSSNSVNTKSMSSMPPPQTPSQLPSSSQSLLSSRSTPPPAMPRSNLIPNPNSLLAAFASVSKSNNSSSSSIKSSTPNISPNSSVSSISSTSPSNQSTATNDLLKLFNLPEIFNNTNLISHFLKNSPPSSSISNRIPQSIASGSGKPSGSGSTGSIKNSILINTNNKNKYSAPMPSSKSNTINLASNTIRSINISQTKGNEVINFSNKSINSNNNSNNSNNNNNNGLSIVLPSNQNVNR